LLLFIVVPQCPRSASGQPVIFDQVGMLSLSAVPWRQNLLVMLLGLYCYETAQTLLQKKAAKGKAAAGAKQQVRTRALPASCCNILLNGISYVTETAVWGCMLMFQMVRLLHEVSLHMCLPCPLPASAVYVT
jgi:hypothetical protein